MSDQLVYVNRYLVLPLCILLLIATSLPASAAATWDENVDGDLANTVFEEYVTGNLVGDYNVNAVPTDIGQTSVGVGVNLVTGTSQASTSVDRFDAFTFEVLAGQTVTAINLTTVSAPANQTSTISLTERTNTAPDPDEYTVVPGSSASYNLAPGVYELLTLFNAAPLDAGFYGFDIRSTFDDGADTTYTLDFVVIPEPGVLALLATGSAIMIARRRRTS